MRADGDVVLGELWGNSLAVITLRSDRSQVTANSSARRLLQYRVGLELDDGRVRCTDSDQMLRFARMVSDAASAARVGRDFHAAFELRPGAKRWLGVVVASHPEKCSPYTLVICGRGLSSARLGTDGGHERNRRSPARLSALRAHFAQAPCSKHLGSTYAAWGCAIAMEFNNSGGDDPVIGPYTGPATCFDIELSGTSGGNPVRIQVAQTATPGLNGEPEVSPCLEIPAVTGSWSGTVCFGDVDCPDGADSTQCVITGEEYSLQVMVPGGDRASTFSLCLTSVIPQ